MFLLAARADNFVCVAMVFCVACRVVFLLAWSPFARIRKHRRKTRKPGDASRLVGWPSYPRNRQRIAANGQEQTETGVLPSFQQPPHFQLFFFNSRQCAWIA